MDPVFLIRAALNAATKALLKGEEYSTLVPSTQPGRYLRVSTKDGKVLVEGVDQSN